MLEDGEIVSIEHSTLKVPYEIINKSFRVAQKVYDKEMSIVQQATSQLSSALSKDSTSVTDAIVGLDSVILSLKALRDKTSSASFDEIGAIEDASKRSKYLDSVAVACSGPTDGVLASPGSTIPSSISQQVWDAYTKDRHDRLLVEYLLRQGFYDSARLLADRSNLHEICNLDNFLVAKSIEQSLLHQDVGPCLAWCAENRSKLRKLKSRLENDLRQQQFIQLVADGFRAQAVIHARKHISPNCSTPEEMANLQTIMALLAFPSTTTVAPYRDLFNSTRRWAWLVSQFRNEFFRCFQVAATPALVAALQSGLSALKTSHCYCADETTRVIDCPICSRHLNQLAHKLPSAHQTQSRLLCPYSHEPLNEHNPPMMLPNGRVYGEKSLQELADANAGRIVCPKTHAEFDMSEVEKIFIM